jgi:pimeloyl-ACP methyl ester carboxylesterase
MEVSMQERKSNGIAYIAGSWPLSPEKSTIVFIHAAGGSSAFWKSQVSGLAERVNTVAIDLPGHGRSAGSGNDSVVAYARAVSNFINEIKAPGPIACGLSMGGAITQQLLLDYRDQIRAGILISTGARLRVAPLIFDTIEKDYNGFAEMLTKFATSQKTDPALVQPFKEELAGCKPEVAHGDFRACDRFDVMKQLTSIEVPVLVMTAEDDKLTPPKYGEFLEKCIKNVSRAHIMDAGHIVPMEKSNEVNRAIIEFLDRTGL